jgi:hypothetical protein
VRLHHTDAAGVLFYARLLARLARMADGAGCA